MKKSIIIIFTLVLASLNAQEVKQNSQITVNGEGKIAVVPDQVEINFSVTNFGKEATEVKKLNDQTVTKVISFLKKNSIPPSDYKTTKVILNKMYDSNQKKYTYQASQSFVILLKDITKYDQLMLGLVDNGINTVNNIEFKSSKIEQYKTEARQLASLDAKKRANDYVSVLNQKIGRAVSIIDNSGYYQPLMHKNIEIAMGAEVQEAQQTIAIGEIEILSSVTITFALD